MICARRVRIQIVFGMDSYLFEGVGVGRETLVGQAEGQLHDLDVLGPDSTIPGILKKYNREWHVVVGHSGLAVMFEKYIEWDMELSTEARNKDETEADKAVLSVPDLLVPESFLETDVAESDPAKPRYFQPGKFTFTSAAPLRVQPLLTPDNYAEHVLRLIRSAKKRLYFQNQSISILENNYPEFEELLDALG